MRVAILSLIEHVPSTQPGVQPGLLRGLLPVGGRSLLRHQIGLALHIGAKRIVVVAEGISAELVALQHCAEAGGAQFHVVATARALVPLILPEDDVIVLGDGLLAMPDAVRGFLDSGPAVLTLPIETALPLGFERIDLNHASAAAMRLPGRVVASLADLPPEWNVQSALLRLAVQARAAMRAIPSAMLDDGRWTMVRSEPEALQAEQRWLRLHTDPGDGGKAIPGERLAVAGVRRFGPALLHAGTRPGLVGLGAGLVLLLAAGLGWLGYHATAFALVGLGWFIERIASLIGRVERDSLLAAGLTRHGSAVFHLLIDASLVALASWRSELRLITGLPAGAAAFVPLLLVASLRLVPLALPHRRWASILKDRLLAGLALACASLLLPFDLAMAVAVLVLLGGCMWDLQFGKASPNPQLTTGA
ncbi:MAG: hypothetical protein ACK4UL_13175 [Novosphingobium meiothermophilum]|uniref:hypothetical protein n=1 Tax=Novosphingobium TaxID=165696 RepID=UPI000D6E58A4|nr:MULTISPECIES: hypothetical protein [Novosphingobium]